MRFARAGFLVGIFFYVLRIRALTMQRAAPLAYFELSRIYRAFPGSKILTEEFAEKGREVRREERAGI
jgi:hypothetical protein